MKQKQKSKYLDKFLQASSDLKFIGDVILVEKIPHSEIKTKSGIIIADSKYTQAGAISADRPHWATVLAVGEGYYNDETKEDVPLDVSPGDVVLLGQMSVRYFSTAEVIQDQVDLGQTYQPDTIGVSRESEILAKIKNGAESVESNSSVSKATEE